MRAHQVVGMLVGSWLVSLACAGPAPRDAERDAGRRLVDSAVELLEDVLGVDTSVADARADDAAPLPAFTVDEVTCPPSETGFGLAEKAYPGRTVDDLARAQVVTCGPGVGGTAPGYDCIRVSGVLLRDGGIAVNCSPGYRLRFILPR